MRHSITCVIGDCKNTQMPHSMMCSHHIAESQRKTVPCSAADCTNIAAVKVNSDYLCMSCAKHEIPLPPRSIAGDFMINTDLAKHEQRHIDAAAVSAAGIAPAAITMGLVKPAEMICPDHWCERHQANTGEGDICHMCEADFDAYRDALNQAMQLHQYELWFVLSGVALFKCPVVTFDQAKLLYLALSGASGVRIARYDPTEGCESTLHEFN